MLTGDQSGEKSSTFCGLIYYPIVAMYTALWLFSTASLAMLSSVQHWISYSLAISSDGFKLLQEDVAH